MLDLRIFADGRTVTPFDLPTLLGRDGAAREIAETIEALIAFLDDLGGDPDLEDGGDLETIDEREPEHRILERYGIDQSQGPTNGAQAYREHILAQIAPGMAPGSRCTSFHAAERN